MNNSSKTLKVALLFVCVVLLLAAIPVFRFGLFVLSPLDSHSTESKILEIRRGISPNELTKSLVNQGIIADFQNFLWTGKITRKWSQIKAGEYKLSPAMSPAEIFSTLTSGISIGYPITVREGENIYEIADDLASKGLAGKEQFLSLTKDPQFIRSLGLVTDKAPPSLEGYLFPDTYLLNRSQTTQDMIRQMVRHFFQHWGEKEESRAKELRMTRHEVITLASIVEKETGSESERPLISSVFHNRLKKRMRLQSDPTTIYGIWHRYRGNIHKSDLMSRTPYNTYAVDALPIGPISNPGKEAIQAALYPVESPYFYFVSHNDGTHEFSRTIEEHSRAVKKYQLDPRSREGKSWRDLQRAPKGKS